MLRSAAVRRRLAALAALAFLASGCESGALPGGARMLVGETRALEEGSLRSWMALTPRGEPVAIGISFAEAALASLSSDAPLTLTLALPAGVAGAVFDHIELDWLPAGHEPRGLFDQPHLDLRFSVLSARERDAIGDSAKAVQVPVLDLVPRSHILVPRLVPRLGAYWIDPTAPAFNGQPFTDALLYGFYDGTLVALEPKVTRAWLESKQSLSREIKLPRQYARPGYYPTRYRVRYDAAAREYSIALERLVRRP